MASQVEQITRMLRETDLMGIEAMYPNWRRKFKSLAEAIKWHTESQDGVIKNLRNTVDILREKLDNAQ